MASSKIGKAFAKEPVEVEVTEEDASAEPDAEVLAMKAFSKASSPEAKVSALKDFLRACGALGYEEDSSDEDSDLGGMSSDLGF